MNVDARITMRFVFLILLTLLIAEAYDDPVDERAKQRILDRQNRLKLEISQPSKSEFLSFMASYCLNNLSPVDFLTGYLKWEKYYFMESIRETLDPLRIDKFVDDRLYYLGLDFATNCSLIDERKKRNRHEEIRKEADLDTWFYNQMTRASWAEINL